MAELRKATGTDLPAVFALICELERGGSEKMELSAFAPVFQRNIHDENIVYMVAEDEGKIIGFSSMHVQMLLHHCGAVAEVQELVVAQGCRGRGAGVLLLSELEAEARRRGCLQIELCCNKNRIASNEFYGRRGFLNSHNKHTMKFRAQ
jgi:(aminoalkyl)phosphonate N-acetyltransferase